MKITIIVEIPTSKKVKKQDIRASLENAFPDYQVIMQDSDKEQFNYSLENSSINPFMDSLGNDVSGEFVLSKVNQILGAF